MDTNECSQPTSTSSWDSNDFGDISMVLKMVHFHSWYIHTSWWPHQMETFSALLAIFVRGIHRSPQKGQWRVALMFSLICVWINGWVNNREAGYLRRYRAHYDVTVMLHCKCFIKRPLWTVMRFTSPVKVLVINPLFNIRNLATWKTVVL